MSQYTREEIIEKVRAGESLVRANLNNVDLNRANLKGANLKATNLSGANLSGANLSGANLSSANIGHAMLIGADLSCADLRACDIRNTILVGADLKDAKFNGATIDGSDFRGANLKNVNLDERQRQRATFKKIEMLKTSFYEQLFAGEVDFSEITFSPKAVFSNSQFSAKTDFTKAIFEDDVIFEGNKNKNIFAQNAPTLFVDVTFSDPPSVKFRNANLDKCSFLFTDISQVDFTGVIWANKKDITWSENKALDWFRGLISCNRRILYDEVVSVREKSINHVLVEKLYRQLKINYEANKDYIRAGDFHYGEMEMRRLQHKSRLARNFFSLLAWYKYLSGYGDRHWRVFFWFVLILFIPPGLYLLSGMGTIAGKTYFEYNFTGASSPDLLSHYFEALLYSLQTLTLFRNPIYIPMAWGRWVAVFQKVMGLFLATLFALALKRRFKR